MTDLTKGRILVTGGAGFIGSAIVWALNRRGCENILISDFLRKSDKWKNLAPLKYADYLEADDLETLILNQPQQLADVRTIFHLGAHSSTTEMDAAYLVRTTMNTRRRWLILRWKAGADFCTPRPRRHMAPAKSDCGKICGSRRCVRLICTGTRSRCSTVTLNGLAFSKP